MQIDLVLTTADKVVLGTIALLAIGGVRVVIGFFREPKRRPKNKAQEKQSASNM